MIVPWMPKKRIAAAAAGVIETYLSRNKQPVNPPVPIEDIIEKGLDLRLSYSDLKRKLDLDDILGATYVDRKLICVDESLLRDRFEGRLCFTFAHEAGHWVLHREHIHRACRQGANDAFIHRRRKTLELKRRNEIGISSNHKPRPEGGGAISPDIPQPSEESFIFCRIKDAKQKIEWQADYFAACLLMPEPAVKRAFYQCYGCGPLRLYNVKSAFCGPICFDPCVENWPQIAGMVKKVGAFSNVSNQAMIIRLQDLGLVKNETGCRMSWGASYAVS
jgi:Zn-dependent peptidase ImmA (M78 family)